MWLSLALLGLGATLLEAGLAWVYPPAAVIAAGAVLLGYALIRDVSP